MPTNTALSENVFTFEYHEGPNNRAVIGPDHAIKLEAQKQLGQVGLAWWARWASEIYARKIHI